MGPDVLKGIQQSMSAGPDMRPVLIIFGVCSLLMLLILLRIFLRQWQRRRHLEQRWQQFHARLAQAGTSAEERTVLSQMAARDGPEEPTALLDELEVFEKGVQHFMAPLVRHGDREEARRVADIVAGLRERLGFAQHRARVFVSTRELDAGHHVYLWPADGEGEAAGRATVAARREDLLPLENMELSDPLQPGRLAHLQFHGDGRLFRCETEVLSFDGEAQTCQLAHTIDIRAADAREYHRAHTERPVLFRADWESADVARQGTLVNLSAGGAALAGRCYYQAGERLVIRLEPGALFEDADEPGADMETREVTGMVLESRRTEGEECLYRVEFRDVERDVRQYLFRLVQSLELSARRAEQ